MQTFTIRVGQDADWEEMQDVYRQAGQAAWTEILSIATLAQLSAPDKWRPDAGTMLFVAERERAVVGFVCCGASDESGQMAEIRACSVMPAAWSLGIGQALLAAARQYLAGSGFKEVIVWTERRNYRPLRFYQAAGWKLDGGERRYAVHGTEITELRHRLVLNATDS